MTHRVNGLSNTFSESNIQAIDYNGLYDDCSGRLTAVHTDADETDLTNVRFAIVDLYANNPFYSHNANYNHQLSSYLSNVQCLFMTISSGRLLLLTCVSINRFTNNSYFEYCQFKHSIICFNSS